MSGKHDPTPPGTDCVVERPTICSTPGVGAVNAARRASLNQPPTPCARGVQWASIISPEPREDGLTAMPAGGGPEFFDAAPAARSRRANARFSQSWQNSPLKSRGFAATLVLTRWPRQFRQTRALSVNALANPTTHQEIRPLFYRIRLATPRAQPALRWRSEAPRSKCWHNTHRPDGVRASEGHSALKTARCHLVRRPDGLEQMASESLGGDNELRGRFR